MMITWLLLVSLFCKSTQDGNGQENDVCGPQDLVLTTSEQTITSTWKDNPSCSALYDRLIYELQVFIADKQVHYEEFVVTPDEMGSTHSWNWTSHLALECAPHLVRLRSRYNGRESQWKQEQTHHGIETLKQPEVFPRDKRFKVGSRVTFCCIVPAGEVFNKLYLRGYSDFNMNTTRISNQTYTLTGYLNHMTHHSCTNVICKTNKHENGACAYIGYPPGDKNLQCETQNLQSVECHWTVGDTYSGSQWNSVDYYLLDRKCENRTLGRCKMDVQVNAGERNWTLTAQNEFGKVELSDRADLTKRVRLIAPKEVNVSNTARNVTLKWRWMVQQYYHLNLTCQVKVGETNKTSENFGVGLDFVILNNLIPNYKYDVTVRCRTAQHLWTEWNKTFTLCPAVPDAPDVWMQVKDAIVITWKKPLAEQCHQHIKDYEVTWTKATARDEQNRTNVQNTQRFVLNLDTTEEYIVTVTARNLNGTSPPSTITIPSLNSDKTKRAKTSRIAGGNGSFSLSWSASPIANCGYIVDWCPTVGSCNVEWLKVPPNETSANIFSNFIEGVRYSLSVYACTQGAPVLLESREGYVREKRIEDGLFKSLTLKKQDSDVEVSWDPINPEKQPAFINGYVLYCWDTDSNVSIIVSTDDPAATILRVKNIKISSYIFEVKARTKLGECGTTSFTSTLNLLEPAAELDKNVFISLGVVGLLLFIIIPCFRHWTWLKQKAYPSIPKPVLTEKWLTSESYPLHKTWCHQSDGDTADVLVLHCNSVAQNKSYANHSFASSQTPNNNYNRSLQTYIPPPLDLRPTTPPAQTGLLPSQFSGIRINRSYNLIVQTVDQQSFSAPELQVGPYLEKDFCGYQPQSAPETFTLNQGAEDPESPMSCVTTYILCP